MRGGHTRRFESPAAGVRGYTATATQECVWSLYNRAGYAGSSVLRFCDIHVLFLTRVNSHLRILTYKKRILYV